MAPSYIGHVLRASTKGFDFGTRGNEIDQRHSFGSLVISEIAGQDAPACFAVGLIYAINISDDPFVRELVMASEVNESTLLDQRKNRLVPIETMVLNVGYIYFEDGAFMNPVHSMPPRPPLSLTEVYTLPPDGVLLFTEKADFFRTVLNAGDVPSDDLLAATLRYTASFITDEGAREQFLIRSGRHMARLLHTDLRRLSYLLNLIRP